MLARHRTDELMDDPALDARSHDHALAGLRRINAWTRSHRLLWPVVSEWARRTNADGRSLHVIDVATGSGDAPIAMACLARQAGLAIDWTLVDRSAHALSVAVDAARRAKVDVRTVEADVVAGALPIEGDLVTCSLFLHHCERPDAVRVLRHMAGAARLAIAVTDLDRTRAGLLLAWLGSRILSRSSIVHHDAPASVRAAFRADEILEIAREAGVDGTSIAWRWPARWTLVGDRACDVTRGRA